MEDQGLARILGPDPARADLFQHVFLAPVGAIYGVVIAADWWLGDGIVVRHTSYLCRTTEGLIVVEGVPIQLVFGLDLGGGIDLKIKGK